MKVADLIRATKLAAKLSNSSSLVPLYRCIEIQVDRVRACSEHGIIEILIQTGLEETSLVDLSTVNAVLGSLPSQQDLLLTRQGNNVYWNCGDTADGYWPIVEQPHSIPNLTYRRYPWSPPDDFADALLLASSVNTAAAISFGMYGVEIERRPSGLQLVSCRADDSLACVTVDDDGYPATEKITIRPPVPSALAAILRAWPNSMMDVSRDGIFVQGDWLTAALPVSPHLSCDLFAIADRYSSQNCIAKIDTFAIKRFLSRTKLLADVPMRSAVDLVFAAGHLLIQHKALAQGCNEVFLAQLPNDAPQFAPFTVAVEEFQLLLEHIDSVVLDHLPNNVLVMRGKQPEFQYAIGGVGCEPNWKGGSNAMGT